jgi:muramidase (phage lysozyme)
MESTDHIRLALNLQAFLDMIAHSEIGDALLAKSDNGYNVLVGGALFVGYADHPRVKVNLGKGLWSTAAGRYQILAGIWDSYRKLLNLPDFSPASQDAVAARLIRERGAYPDIEAGNFDSALVKVHTIWASLPGAGYGQHENKLANLRAAYTAAGGTLANA